MDDIKIQITYGDKIMKKDFTIKQWLNELKRSYVYKDLAPLIGKEWEKFYDYLNAQNITYYSFNDYINAYRFK